MNWADYGIIGIVTLSTIIGLFRGFVKESISLVFWILAFYVAFVYFKPIAHLMQDYISNETTRNVIGFLGLLIATLIIGGIVNVLFSKLVQKTGLSGTDRMIGLIFGILRGVLLIAVLLLVAKATNMTNSTWWKESTVIPYFDGLVSWLQSLIPDSLTQYMQNHQNAVQPNGAPAGAGSQMPATPQEQMTKIKEVLKKLLAE